MTPIAFHRVSLLLNHYPKFLTCGSNQIQRHGVIGAVCLLAQRGRARNMRAEEAEEGTRDQVLWLGSLLPRFLTTPNGSQRLPTAPYD